MKLYLQHSLKYLYHLFLQSALFFILGLVCFLRRNRDVCTRQTERSGGLVITPSSYMGGSVFKSRPENRLSALRSVVRPGTVCNRNNYSLVHQSQAGNGFRPICSQCAGFKCVERKGDC
jgi:hypothetical protein